MDKIKTMSFEIDSEPTERKEYLVRRHGRWNALLPMTCLGGQMSGNFVYFSSYLPDPWDEETNLTDYLNTAIADTAADRRILIIDNFDTPYRLGPASGGGMVKLVDNAEVWAYGARFLRADSTEGPIGWIAHDPLTTPLENVRWYGGSFDANYSGGYAGNVFNFWANNSVFRDMQVTNWGDGRLMGIAGSSLIVSGVRARYNESATMKGTGGIRYSGGDLFLCYGCDVVSGDDTYQLVPTAAGTARGNLDITRATYVNCIGGSDSARLCIAALPDEGGEPMTCSILNSSFSNIRGHAGGIGLVVGHKGISTGIVSGIQLSNIVVDCSATSSRGLDIGDNVESEHQLIEGIYCTNVRILSPSEQALYSSGRDVRRLYFVGGYLGAPRESGVPTVDLSVDGGAIRDTTIVSGGNLVALLNGCSHFELTGNDLVDIPAEKFAIGVGTTTTTAATTGFVLLQNNRFQPVASVTSAKGILVGGSDCTISGNDFTAMDTPISVLESAERLIVGPNFRAPALEEVTETTNNSLVVGQDAPYLRFTALLTANRNLTALRRGAPAGATFRITRPVSSPPNTYTVTVRGETIGGGTVDFKVMAEGEWCEICFDGVEWYLSASGTL